MLVGEMGMDRQAVLFELDMSDVRGLIRAYRRRERTQWTTTRWLIWSIASMLGGKQADSPEEMMRFPWEKEEVMSDEDKAELERMVEEARKWNAEHDKKGNIPEDN